MRLAILFVLSNLLLIQSYGQKSDPTTPRIAARLILADSLIPSDDSMIFMVMDSIVATKRSVRDYYFPAFQKIVDKADGALAEVIGSYVLMYVKKYPVEFSNRFKSCEGQRECWNNMLRQAALAGEETMMRHDNKKEYNDLIDQMTLAYKGWRSDLVLSKFVEKVEGVRRDWKD